MPQTPTKQVTKYSTPVTTTPEPPTNTNITAPMTIPYNESELDPSIHPMFNHHRPSTHRYPTWARNKPRNLTNSVLKEHTLNMCMAPEMVDLAIIPLWSLQHSATHQPTTHCVEICPVTCRWAVQPLDWRRWYWKNARML